METTEKIVEAYVRYYMKCATIANIKCGGQKEIDLLAVNPANGERYHIESSVSISQSFSKLNTKPFDREKLRERVQVPKLRRTIDYFAEMKFSDPHVLKTLAEYGFKNDNYSKIVVAWGYTDDVPLKAQELNITIWAFPEIMARLTELFKDNRIYYIDDTLRTLHLYYRANLINQNSD